MAVIYFHISMLITLIRIYMELVYRIVDKNVSKQMILDKDENDQNILGRDLNRKENPVIDGGNSENDLFVNLQRFMTTNQAWRDPNISLSMLTEKLGTNRTTLSKAIHDSGIDNFSVYINEMRISDFISLMNSRKNISIKEAFFISGYRSRTTALRNFKAITGQIPSDYFGRNSDEVEW
jgi:AraC-like DNA-binding protein